MAVSAFTFSAISMTAQKAQAKSMAWAKIDYGKDLYGLPQVMMFHKRDFAKIDYGESFYGFPNIADNRGITWAKIGYGNDLYGLPHISGKHKG